MGIHRNDMHNDVHKTVCERATSFALISKAKI